MILLDRQYAYGDVLVVHHAVDAWLATRTHDLVFTDGDPGIIVDLLRSDGQPGIVLGAPFQNILRRQADSISLFRTPADSLGLRRAFSSKRATGRPVSLFASSRRCIISCFSVFALGCYLSTVKVLVAQDLMLPEDGFGLQQAVLEEVAAKARGPTALLWTSSRYVGATHPETRLPGFGKAARLAEESGFPVLVRNSGGGAVAANEGSISFSLTLPVEDLRHGLYERYTEGANLIVATLGKLGVRAEPGAVEGEFCPGAYSVRTGGYSGTKVAGLAQRVARRAARIEALVLVTKSTELRGVFERFYKALGLPFRPESVADLPGVSVPEAIEAFAETLRESYGAREAEPSEEMLLRAHALRESWRATSGRSESSEQAAR